MQADNLFSPVRSSRLSTEITGSIRSKIIGGLLEPGSKLPAEREMALQFGVTRPTVREALRELEHAGLVTVKNGRNGGVFVNGPSLEAVSEAAVTMVLMDRTGPAEFLEARCFFEPILAELATKRATDQELAGIGESFTQMQRRGLTKQHYLALNLAFHARIAEAAHNRVLLMMFQSISKLAVDQVYGPEVLGAMESQHRRILEALIARDPIAARAAVREHMEYFRNQLPEGASVIRLQI